MALRSFVLSCVVLLVGSALAGAQAAETVPVVAQPQKIEDVEGITAENLYLDGRVYIAGQPDEAALGKLAERGVTAVVNARTPSEM